MSPKALDGLKVVEYAGMVSGPYCGKLLADMGADVIKVEPPGGDPSRQCGPFPGGVKDPEKSALFLYNNTSKRGIVLDIDKPEGLSAFKKLLVWADVFIDNQAAAYFEKRGLGWDELQKLNPGLTYCTITPYGRTGPRANAKGDELTIMHAGGEANLLPVRSIDLSLPPVKIGGYQAGYTAALQASVALMAVYLEKMKTGKGRMIDVSMQEVIINLLLGVLHSSRYDGMTWCRVTDRPPAMGRMQTSDGYVVLGALDDHHFHALRELIGMPDWLKDDRWDDRVWRSTHLMEIAPQLDDWMRTQKKQEISRRIGDAAIPVGAVNTAQDVMNYEQYHARGYFTEVDHPRVGKYLYAGWPYKMTASPPAAHRPAPLLGEHTEEVFRDIINKAEAAAPVEIRDWTNKIPALKQPFDERHENLPLQGLRVLEFCWVWAGPYATMLLANLGAEVIKIEGHTRTDLIRRAIKWPREEPEASRLGLNKGMSYNSINRNKKSITLDLSKKEGIALAKKLVAMSDIVIDNMRPDAMIKMGLGYEELRKIKPDLIDISTSGRGHEGPESKHLGFATIHQSIGGYTYISGHPEDHPTHGSPGNTDVINAVTTTYAALAAFHHRLNTGEGQFIDYSQCEGVTSMMGEQLLGYLMTGVIPERMGNAHPEYAPHNVYQCWGVDRWLALECHTDEEFRILARVIGKPELTLDPRFAAMVDRKKNEKELDRIISEWTRQRDRDWMVTELVNAGLACAPSRDGKDIYADRHLQARNFFVTIDHPERGELVLAGPPWKVSGCQMPAIHAPLLGEHNELVFRELLHLTDAQLADLRRTGIIMKEPIRKKS
jgi:crotonobetainyl-CoA:carnitine CoA-transferase CaiB-like acyl-CoA transferase